MSQPAHILAVPYPAQGHILPLLDFLHQLLLRHAVTVTIVITPANLPIISSLLSAHPASIQTLTLPFPSHPLIPSGIENVKDLGWIGNLAMINTLPQLALPIAQWYHSHPNPPVAIFSDLFLGWTRTLAQELKIEHFVFSSSGVFLASIFYYCWTHEELREMELVEFSEIPGSPSFKKHELPSLFHRYDPTSPEWKGVRKVLRQSALPNNWVINSFYEMEDKFFDYLRREFSGYSVYAVGPVSIKGLNNRTAENSDFSPLFDWLDSSPAGSVLYVSFGSQKFLSEEQVEGLAMGLEKSSARFVWVAKFQSGGCNLPAGFEERVSGRGVLLKNWAPQVRILRHPAVGGFLSHCGWNSILEAMEAGVPLLAWPMEADQYLNAWLLETYLEVAIRACEGSHTVPQPEKLSAAIRQWCDEGEGTLRLKASELKDMALAAVMPGGSSGDDLDSLCLRLSQLSGA